MLHRTVLDQRKKENNAHPCLLSRFLLNKKLIFFKVLVIFDTTMHMVLLTLVLVLTSLVVYARRCWNEAKQKHRDEKLMLCVFFHKWYWRTGIECPRAYMKVFDLLMCKIGGFAFEGVQAIIYHNNNVCVSVRSPDRRKNWIFDIGMGGMVISNETPQSAAEHELYEELNITRSKCESFKHVKTVLPSDGYSCIIHIYHGVLVDDSTVIDTIKSNDGTYSKILWCDAVRVSDCMSQEKIQNSELTHINAQLSKKDAMCMIDQGLI